MWEKTDGDTQGLWEDRVTHLRVACTSLGAGTEVRVWMEVRAHGMLQDKWDATMVCPTEMSQGLGLQHFSS